MRQGHLALALLIAQSLLLPLAANWDLRRRLVFLVEVVENEEVLFGLEEVAATAGECLVGGVGVGGSSGSCGVGW